jgi:C1A family cysteine protease
MLQNFANNDDIIEAHNAQGLSYTLGHNKFSGMSVEEWRAYVHLGLSRPGPDSSALLHSAPVDASSLPASVDWTAQGKVTPVKDQGQCGSCW